MVSEKMSFDESQEGRRGGRLKYQNEIILAILNLHVSPVPPSKCRLNRDNGLRGDVV